MKFNFYTPLTALLVWFFPLSLASASVTVGSIDSTYKYAWGENIGWVNFSAGNVTVTDTALTGYAWSENYGWIILNPAQGGVLNNGEGNLSGHAWGESLGYIDFDGVSIDSNGYFLGYATSTLSGDISFNCSNTNSCASSDFKVRTDWRPASTRDSLVDPVEEVEEVEEGSGGGDNGANVRIVRPSTQTIEENETNTSVPSFTDTQNHWAESYVSELIKLGLADGTSEDTFEPDRSITRAEFVKIIVNALLLTGEIKDLITNKNTFSDVPSDLWATPYIETAKAVGLVQGYSNQEFAPDKSISREEAALILSKLIDVEPVVLSSESHFSDVPDGEWYSGSISTLKTLGIFDGYENGSFGLGHSITRAESAKVIIKVYQGGLSLNDTKA